MIQYEDDSVFHNNELIIKTSISRLKLIIFISVAPSDKLSNTDTWRP